MNKMLALILVMLLVVSASAETYRTKNRVNVRKEPSGKILGYLVEDTVVTGDKILYDSENKPWLYAKTPKGTGYVSLYSLILCEENVTAKTVKLKFAKNYGKFAKGTVVEGVRFYPTKSGTKIMIRIGDKSYKLPATYLIYKGKKVPKLPTKVRLKKEYRMGGESHKKGTELNVEFYFFGKDGKLYADCHEGHVPTSLLR